MTIFATVLILLFLAGAYWLVNLKYPDKVRQPFKFLINVVLIGSAIFLVLYAFGIWDTVRNARVPKL